MIQRNKFFFAVRCEIYDMFTAFQCHKIQSKCSSPPKKSEKLVVAFRGLTSQYENRQIKCIKTKKIIIHESREDASLVGGACSEFYGAYICSIFQCYFLNLQIFNNILLRPFFNHLILLKNYADTNTHTKICVIFYFFCTSSKWLKRE